MGAAVFLAFLISVVSLLLHWARSREHPDVSQARQEVATLATQVQELRNQHLDLLDKVEHWVKRDRVRRLRESREQTDDKPAAEGETRQQWKARMREQLSAKR
jgi:hypothetical protein